jgi:N-acylglucosamine-6-phosphate 2-epimerase
MRRLPYGLIASVQASGNQPLNQPQHLVAMAQSCLSGGASGLRLSDLAVMAQCKQLPGAPFVIGLTKPESLPADPLATVYITPTVADALAVCATGADMVALDATTGPLRLRPEPLEVIVSAVRQHYPHCGMLADCATLDDALNAQRLGMDGVSTTLSGYTTETATDKDLYTPDWALLQAMVAQCQLPVVLEGRVWTPAHVAQGMHLGACAVIAGSVLTRPQNIVAYLATGLCS